MHDEPRDLPARPDDLLTTGQAARVLGASRQHVVDLCDRGDLGFSTVGGHRRVRRGDVEQLAARTVPLTRDQRRSLWLAHAVAGQVVADPAAARRLAADNLATMVAAHGGGSPWWARAWQDLLDGPVEELVAALVSPAPRCRDLRQCSPFAGLLPDDERARVLDAWSAQQ